MVHDMDAPMAMVQRSRGLDHLVRVLDEEGLLRFERRVAEGVGEDAAVAGVVSGEG